MILSHKEIEEIAAAVVQDRHFAVHYAVRVRDYKTLRRLAEYLL